MDNYTILSPNEEKAYLKSKLHHLFHCSTYRDEYDGSIYDIYVVNFDAKYFEMEATIDVQLFGSGDCSISPELEFPFKDNFNELFIKNESGHLICLQEHERVSYCWELSNSRLLDNSSIIVNSIHWGEEYKFEFKCRYEIPNLFLLIDLFIFERKELTDEEIDELYDASFASIEAAVQEKKEREARKAEAERQRKINEEKAAPAPQANNGCYIATCVYGSYDCPEVWILRRFRDYTLDETWYGRAFIKTYYAISPTLVKWFGKTNWFKSLFKKLLNSLVSKLRSNGVSSLPYNDKY